MINIEYFKTAFLTALEQTFPNRVWFVGLQGSYGRGEATEDSDIDMVVILDELSCADIAAYNAMLDRLPHRELICGFLSGKEELLNWEPADLFQFYYDTTPIQGSMEKLLSVIDREAVNRAIHTAACNIYHGCVHNMLYEKDAEMLKGLYKAASFAVQAIYFRDTGRYIRLQTKLMDTVGADEKAIVQTFLHLKNGGEVCFLEMSEELYLWTKKEINRKDPQ